VMRALGRNMPPHFGSAEGAPEVTLGV